MNYVSETFTVSANVGFGGRPWGEFAWGDIAYDTGDVANLYGNLVPTTGWGAGAWGEFIWGILDYTDPMFAREAPLEGLGILEYGASISTLGLYVFGFLTFDQYDNYISTGLDTQQYYVCLEPQQPDPPGLLEQDVLAGTITLNR